jgi:hypothetical protein
VPAQSTLNNQPQSVFDPKQAKALSPFDIAKQMNISWYWDLPVGYGKSFLTNAGKWRIMCSATGGFPLFNRTKAGTRSASVVWS